MPEERDTEAADVDQDTDQAEGANVEKRLSKLESILAKTMQTLEEERRASAGKDKKITELSLAKKELQESTLSKDKLLEVRQKELDEARNEWEQQRTVEKQELEKLRIEALRTKVVTRLDGFPTFLIDRITGANEDEIEADARNIMKQWVKDGNKRANAVKVTAAPRSGNGKQVAKTADDIRAMSAKEKTQWAATASDDELTAILDEMNQE